jgi:hypothetical protein
VKCKVQGGSLVMFVVRSGAVPRCLPFFFLWVLLGGGGGGGGGGG